MKEKDLLKIINQLLEDNGEDLLSSLDPNLNLRDDIGLDSLSLAHLTILIESEFGVDIYKDGVIKTIQEVYDKVNR